MSDQKVKYRLMELDRIKKTKLLLSRKPGVMAVINKAEEFGYTVNINGRFNSFKEQVSVFVDDGETSIIEITVTESPMIIYSVHVLFNEDDSSLYACSEEMLLSEFGKTIEKYRRSKYAAH